MQRLTDHKHLETNISHEGLKLSQHARSKHTASITNKNCHFIEKSNLPRQSVISQSVSRYLFRLDSRADPPQFLHLSADAQQQAEVNEQRSYVSSRLTAHPNNTWVACSARTNGRQESFYQVIFLLTTNTV